MIPIAGSAYTYAYTTMGEFTAWTIGWALILEYAMGAGTVAIGWSQYLNRLLMSLFGTAIPFELSHSPMEDLDAGVRGMINLPALFIVFVLTALLVKGTQESASVNAVIVAVKVAIVIMFIVIGWRFINPANHTPFTIPAGYPGHEGIFKHGWGGVLGGAGIVFFAFIGFDAVSTAAQETKNPGRDMPIGILGSLAICTVLYILFGYVLTGVCELDRVHQSRQRSFGRLRGPKSHARLRLAGHRDHRRRSRRILIRDSRHAPRPEPRFLFDGERGLLPKIFADVHPKFCTPYKCNITSCSSSSAHWRRSFPIRVLGDLTALGTLFAFVLVSIGIWIMRRAQPDLGAAIQNSAGPAGADSRRAGVYRDDRRTGPLTQITGSRLDVARLCGLLPLQPQPQQTEYPRAGIRRSSAKHDVARAFCVPRRHSWRRMARTLLAPQRESMIRMQSIPRARPLASPAFRFSLAIALVGTALAVTLLLQSVVSTAGFLFFYIAVVASAWFGGYWPGWLAVALSAVTVEYFFMAPIRSFGVNRESVPILIEFAASALIVGWFSSWRRQAEAELRYARDELQFRVEERTARTAADEWQLLAEMAERQRVEDAYYAAQAELERVTRMQRDGRASGFHLPRSKSAAGCRRDQCRRLPDVALIRPSESARSARSRGKHRATRNARQRSGPAHSRDVHQGRPAKESRSRSTI